MRIFDGEHLKTFQKGEIICPNQKTGRNEIKQRHFRIQKGELIGRLSIVPI